MSAGATMTDPAPSGFRNPRRRFLCPPCGRIVAVCFAGTEDVNAWMVRQGWAFAYRHYSLDYVDDEDAAREEGAGIWAGAFTPPWQSWPGGGVSVVSGTYRVSTTSRFVTGPNRP